MSLSLEKILKNPECYMDTDEKFFNKINLHNINQLKVLKDPTILPVIVQKKIKRNDEKIETISRNDDKFTDVQNKRVSRQLKNIQNNINKLTNIHDYSFKSLNTRKLNNIKNLKHIFNDNDNSFDYKNIISNIDNSTKNNTIQVNNDSNNNIERPKNHHEENYIKDDQYFNKEKIIHRSRNSTFKIRNYLSLQTVTKPLSKPFYEITQSNQIKPDSPERDRRYELLENVENPDLTSPITNKKYYKKLLKLKNYDNIVKNLANVKKLLIQDKYKYLRSLSKTLNKSISPNSIAKSNSLISNVKSISPFIMKNQTPIFSSRNIHNFQKKNSINILSRNVNNDNSFENLSRKKSEIKINNVRKSVIDITDELMNGNHRSNIKEKGNNEKNHKSLDRHKVELYKIYRTSVAEEDSLRKLKKNKKLINFDKYQKMLMEHMIDKISLDSMNDLYSKFKEVKEVKQRVEKVPPFNTEKELIKLNEMVDNVKGLDYKKNSKIKDDEEEVVKHKYYKKDKLDYNLKKIEHIIPNYLLEKLKNHKQ